MVSEAILGAVAGGSFAVAGSFVQAWFNRQNAKDRINAQNQRLRAEMYAGQKVEALSGLHSKFVECRQSMSKQLGRRSDDMTTQEIREEIISLVDSLQESLDKSTIFLEESQEEKLSEAYLTISAAGEFLEQDSQEGVPMVPEVKSGELIKKTNAAMEVLEEEINEPIEQFESG